MFPFDDLPKELQDAVLNHLPITDKIKGRTVSRRWNNLLITAIGKESVLSTRAIYADHGDRLVESPECSSIAHRRTEGNTFQGHPSLEGINSLLISYAMSPQSAYIYSIIFSSTDEFNNLLTMLISKNTLQHLEISFCSFRGEDNLTNMPDAKFDNLKHFAFFKNVPGLLPAAQNIILNNLQITELCLGKTAFGYVTIESVKCLQLKKIEVLGRTDLLRPFLQLQRLLQDSKIENIILRDEYDCETVLCSTLAFNFTILRTPNTSMRTLKTASFGSIEKLYRLEELTLLSRNVVVGALNETQYITMLDSSHSENFKSLRIGYGFRCLRNLNFDALALICSGRFGNLEHLGLQTQDGIFDIPSYHRRCAHIWQADQVFLQISNLTNLRSLELNYNGIKDSTIKTLMDCLEHLESITTCCCPNVTKETLQNGVEWASRRRPKNIFMQFEEGKFCSKQLFDTSLQTNLKIMQIRMKITTLCSANTCTYYKC